MGEKSTRQSLGVAGGTADVSLGGFLPGWALHGIKWVAIFVIPDQAENHFEQALRIEPKNAEYHSGDAYLLDQLRREDRAASECETAIRLATKSAQAHHVYGAFLEKHGQPKRQSRDIDRRIDLGSLLSEKGKLTEAGEHFEKASELNPKLPQPHNYLGKF